MLNTMIREASRLITTLLDPIRQSTVSGRVEPKSNTDLEKRLETAFRDTERTGLMLAVFVRTVIVGGLVLFFASTRSFLGDGYTYLITAPLGLVAIGMAQFFVARSWPHLTWTKYVFIAADCAYLAALLILRHTLANDLPPVTTAVKEGALLFFTAFLIHAAFSYSPRFVLWTGLCITFAWIAVLFVAITTPGVFFRLDVAGVTDSNEVWRRYGDSSYLPIIKIVYDYVIIAFLTVGLAVAVWRSRRLVLVAALAERARSNLSRHFSPAVVDLLSRRDRPFEQVCWQRAAVLFADIRGFTTRCETMAPEETIAFLRQFHSRMEACIFNNGGTLDRIVGDGCLAVFGMPDEGAADARNSLACAFDMLSSIDAWNGERNVAGEFEVRIGIGLHYGNVMLGDVGSDRLMTFTVIGDTVNVASRLEGLSKDLHTPLVASNVLVEAARAEGHAGEMLKRLADAGSHTLRGRAHDLAVFVLQEAPPQTA